MIMRWFDSVAKDGMELKKVTAGDGEMLRNLFDYPLQKDQAAMLASRLAADQNMHALILFEKEMQGILEEENGWIGYRIRSSCRRRGMASRALRIYLAWRDRVTDAPLWAMVDCGNTASLRILCGNGFFLVKEDGETRIYARK